jgi:phosphatidylglycerol:prolipoprotein diacylglycerol transferase
MQDSATLLLAAVKARTTAEVSSPSRRAAQQGTITAGSAAAVAGKTAPGPPRTDQHSLPAGSSLQIASFACEPLKDATPQSLGVTYWFDAAPSGKPYPVSVRLVGRWLGRPEPSVDASAADPVGSTSFDIVRTVEGIVPGSGRTCITVRIPALAPGEWEVSASAPDGRTPEASTTSEPVAPSTAVTARAPSTYGPVVNVLAPGARLGAWPALVASGAMVALLTQWFLAARSGLSPLPVLVISLVACLVGLIGAKAYYLITHRAEKPPLLTAGMCIQGFVISAIVIIALGTVIAHIPLGAVLDASVPGLLFGMAIGRLGCFFGGCCAGRPSAARWAMWSSDRTMGTRRLPVQLVESSMSALIGIAAFVALIGHQTNWGGAVFLAAIAANTLGRQILFPMRSTPRATVHGRTATLVGSVVALIAGVTLAMA